MEYRSPENFPVCVGGGGTYRNGGVDGQRGLGWGFITLLVYHQSKWCQEDQKAEDWNSGLFTSNFNGSFSTGGRRNQPEGEHHKAKFFVLFSTYSKVLDSSRPERHILEWMSFTNRIKVEDDKGILLSQEIWVKGKAEATGVGQIKPREVIWSSRRRNIWMCCSPREEFSGERVKMLTPKGVLGGAVSGKGSWWRDWPWRKETFPLRHKAGRMMTVRWSLEENRK